MDSLIDKLVVLQDSLDLFKQKMDEFDQRSRNIETHLIDIKGILTDIKTDINERHILPLSECVDKINTTISTVKVTLDKAYDTVDTLNNIKSIFTNPFRLIYNSNSSARTLPAIENINLS